MIGSLVQPADRDWIRRCDDHAVARLTLLADAESLLGEGTGASPEQREKIGERVERWRSQWLHERWGLSRFTDVPPRCPEDRRLAAALDHLARRLRDLPAAAARWPRGAVQDHQGDGPEVSAAAAALDESCALEDVVSAAGAATARCFAPPGGETGWPVRLYAPLYLSSHCANRCVYCGFAANLPVERRHLSPQQAGEQAALLMRRGFRHLLLVAGDFPRLTTVSYLAEIVGDLDRRGCEPAVEIAAQSTLGYATLHAAGVRGVTLYMETYDEAAYVRHHPRGPKVSYDGRLEALERAAEAGIPRLGLGVLLGLADPRADLLALVRHGAYLRRRHPGCALAFSLPRIHDAPGGFQVPLPVSEALFVRLYAALRLAFPDADLVLSTREPAALRQRLAGICITQMSAASSTVPGGYEEAEGAAAGGQFPVADGRSVAATVAWLEEAGHPVVWSVADGRPRETVAAASAGGVNA
jgi:2-iminoacetate synthase